MQEGSQAIERAIPFIPGTNMNRRLKIFDHFETATYLRRLNRFVVECIRKGRQVTAYLPNPGRLWELLQEGSTLYLTKTTPTNTPDRRIEYTIVAVEKNGIPVFLHTHHTNTAVGWLIRSQEIRGLEEYSIEKPEFKVGRSRFDFLLKKGNERMLLEVKSCTLFHDGLAMFPDAVTSRGTKHLLHLADSSMRAGVLFVVHSPSPRYFLPEYHVDPQFSQTLYSLRNDIIVKALSVTWRDDLSLEDRPRDLTIPWEIYEKEGADKGSYLLVIYLDRDKEIAVGSLGSLFFEKGYYVYVGSAMKNLTARIERHKRRRKNLFWHVDYLREEGQVVHAIPIRSASRLECEIARSMEQISHGSISRFGSSDCGCHSHLFYMTVNPVSSPQFVNMLLYFRMTRIVDRLNER
jgi:sugar fermentation stimulation protein A